MRFLVLFVSLCLSLGCGSGGSSVPTPQTEDRFERRFIEVIRITDDNKRQQVLVQLVTDAADAGNTANTWKALGWMKDPAGRDAAARIGAVSLASLGKREDAILIANHQITNAELKAKTLAEIEKSKPEK